VQGRSPPAVSARAAPLFTLQVAAVYRLSGTPKRSHATVTKTMSNSMTPATHQLQDYKLRHGAPTDRRMATKTIRAPGHSRHFHSGVAQDGTKMKRIVRRGCVSGTIVLKEDGQFDRKKLRAQR